MVKENKWNHRRDGSDRYEFGLSRKGEITLNIGTIKELMMSKKPFKNGSSESSGDCRQEIKRRLLLGRKVMTNLDSILKSQRHYFANKGPSSQGYGFSSGHVWM